MDTSNNEITSLAVSYDNGGYSGKFKVLYPAASVEGQTGTVQINASADVYKYVVFYALCQETDEYGPLQKYLADTDPQISMEGSGVSRYTAEAITPPPDEPDEPDSPDEPSGSGDLEIIKLEEGTEKPLAGAMFEVKGPDGDVIGTFTTGANGKVQIPVQKFGTHIVREVVPPAYHLLDNEPTKTVTVVEGRDGAAVLPQCPLR